MKKTSVIRSVWVVIAISTALTLYLAYIGVLVEPFRELLIVVEGALIAELFLSKLTDVFRKPTIIIRPISRNNELGFALRVKDKNIENARVFCNEFPVNWRETNGDEKEMDTLFVGKVVTFFPFQNNISIEKVTAEKQAILVSIIRKGVQRPWHVEQLSVPKGCFSLKEIRIYMGCFIRIIGLGIEDPIDRYIDLTCYLDLLREKESDAVEAITADFDFRNIEFVL